MIMTFYKTRLLISKVNDKNLTVVRFPTNDMNKIKIVILMTKKKTQILEPNLNVKI